MCGLAFVLENYDSASNLSILLSELHPTKTLMCREQGSVLSGGRRAQELKTLGFRIENPWVQIQGLSFPGHVTFGTLLYLPKPRPRTTAFKLLVKRFMLPHACNSVHSIFPPNQLFFFPGHSDLGSSMTRSVCLLQRIVQSSPSHHPGHPCGNGGIYQHLRNACRLWPHPFPGSR